MRRLVIPALMLLVASPAYAPLSTLEDCLGTYDPNVGYFYGRGAGSAINHAIWEWRARYANECYRPECIHSGTNSPDYFLNSACGANMYKDVASFGICGMLTLFHQRKLNTGGICSYDRMTFCPSGECLGCYPNEEGKLESYCRCRDSMDCPPTECCSFMFAVCGNPTVNYCPHHFYSNVYEGDWCWFHSSWTSWDNISESHDRSAGCGAIDWGIEGVDWVQWGAVERPNECGHGTDADCKFCKGVLTWNLTDRSDRFESTIDNCYDRCCLDHPTWGICPYCQDHPEYSLCPD